MIEIVRATAADATTLKTITVAAKSYWGYPSEWIVRWGEWVDSKGLFHPDYIVQHDVYKAVRGDTAIGWYALRYQGEMAFLDHMWVIPDKVGEGIGRQLFIHALEQARTHQATRLQLEADPHAVGFYQHMGAKVIGEVPGEMGGLMIPLMALQIKNRQSV